jgi:2-oxoglutarate dehydrogenase E1 component
MGIETLSLNGDFLQQTYLRYLEDPKSVDPSWSRYFSSLGSDDKKSPLQTLSKAPADLRVSYLINSYRTYGHLMADINPIATKKREIPWQLELKRFGFSQEEFNEKVPTLGLLNGPEATLREVVEVLQKIYCGSIGVEFRGVQDPDLESWLQNQIEPTRFQLPLSIEDKKMILQYLNKSELFEIFLHTKYTGQKRFSLEGGEVLIPILAFLIEKGSELGGEAFVLGMAHRGRLNVLSNIMQKSYSQIFTEFEEGYIPHSFEGSGDVKYHKGFSSNVTTSKGKIVEVDLAPNPSHLEAVDPIVEGEVFAKQMDQNDQKKEKIFPILIHGDAAISGQGVVYETMQLYQLKGYGTGGTVHLVINNQIGFTTLPQEGRSTHYCTDIAKAFSAPVFHVNAEDPEGCIIATWLAVELRQKFHCDVFIDINCWRKFGHNEADEPAFTQPLEYQIIRQKKSIREQYRDSLIKHGVVEKQMAETLEKEFKDSLQAALTTVEIPKEHQETDISPKKEPLFKEVATAVSSHVLTEVSEKVLTIPDSLQVHKKLQKVILERKEMAEGTRPIDWGMGEMLSFATLLQEGKKIRLAGQDSGRGTFSHRHAVWMDQQQEVSLIPLEALGSIQIINSPLSEYAALGFEYGYSLASSDTLVLWEAQFGDFCNGAQVVIDQFISTAEQKWNKKSGIVLLLPHGYEGQGPEHSSARMERFLTLCGDNNMVVANPSTPAQLFHLIRRQALWAIKKPLIVFTPKGLLRHPKCVSELQDLTNGSFEEIIDDGGADRQVKRVILCSGHVYYDLIEWRNDKTPIIRIEQLYPLHEEKLQKVMANYPNVEEVLWVQEEPENMGPYGNLRPELIRILGLKPKYIGRKRSASPAAGSHGLHKKQLEALKKEVFG